MYNAKSEVPRVAQFTGRKQNGGCQVLEGGGNSELLFSKCRVSVRKEEKLLEMDGSDGYITRQMYLTSVNAMFKRG